MSTPTVTPPTHFTFADGLRVHRMGYGAMHLTGPGMWGPPTDPDNAMAVLRRAVELGIDFIDTADSYGPGYNEDLIRTALHPYPEGLVIATKGGMLRSGPDDWVRAENRHPYIVALGRPAYLRQQVEVSLLRLGLDHIDLYMLHRIDHTVALEEQLGTLADLRKEGKIRHIGLSGQPEVTVQQLEQARKITEIAAVENLYNIADRAGEDVLDHAERHGIAFIPWFPLGHGDLVGPDGVLTAVAGRYGATGAQLGLAWLLRRSPNTLLIPGTTSVSHLEENVAAAGLRLSDAEWTEIESLCAEAAPWRPDAQEAAR
ncbi:aldo/keto reductase [Streptomyces sediminimaris]|uniref:aldo/keto reductase n=1 Tax=Streptomyces sediminimaris TaxID=3383721 RepID=UPI00399B4CF3